MFEFDKYDRRRGAKPSRPELPYAPLAGVSRRAFLLWGEHCIECAAPDCFATCDLYEARPDRRCRRFEYGVFRNRAFPALAGYGAEIVFRQWGKLEARGNAALMRPGVVRQIERCAALAAPLTNRAGALAGRFLGDIRWSYLTFSLLERFNAWLLRRRRPGEVPDAFVIEIYNPGAAEVPVLFSIAIDRTKVGPQVTWAGLPSPVLERLVVSPGYFRFDLPSHRFRELVESGHAFNLAITPEAPEGTHLVFLTLDFVRYASPRPAAAAARPPDAGRPKAKCVIFDLDNTLWEGVLLEGPVRPREAVREMMRRLDERGILLSVVSKNAPEDAMAQLRAFGLDDYLLHPQIGWNAKSVGVREIARKLDIGLDSLFFVDDSPFERDEVARALPQVEILPETALATLLDHPRLEGGVTPESRTRRQMYRQAIVREAAATQFGSDYLEFLRSCGIELTVRSDRPEDMDRIQELVQRTNQLNFSGRKYDRDALEALLAEPALERHVVECRDRYGSYGIVGFCMTRRVDEGIRIEDLMLSCRVQGKFVEKGLFHHLCTRPGTATAFVEIVFRATDRNAAARAILSDLGFAEAGDDLLRVAVPADRFEPGFLSVNV